MPRFLPAGLEEALDRPDAQISEHSTLEMFMVLSAETRSYYFATAGLNFNGVIWQPHLRKTDEIGSDLTSETDEVAVDLQNVDTILGREFVGLQRNVSGSLALLGRYWKDLDRGTEWHDVLFTGVIAGIDPDEMVVKLTGIPDTYASSVGPLRHIQRLCTVLYKSFECGRPATDPPDCDLTLHGAGGCHGRWGVVEKFIRHAGAPYIDTNLFLKVI